MKNRVCFVATILMLTAVTACNGSRAIPTAPSIRRPQPAGIMDPTTAPDPMTTEYASVCPTANGAETIPPAVTIYSITFAVNGLEQVVGNGGTLEVSSGDEVQVREVIICVESFSGNGGEACVDFVPVSQSGQELTSEHSGTHLVRVTPGFTTISEPSQVWTVGEDWRDMLAVLNHWPAGATQDLSCAGGLCERDDRVTVRLWRSVEQ